MRDHPVGVVGAPEPSRANIMSNTSPATTPVVGMLTACAVAEELNDVCLIVTTVGAIGKMFFASVIAENRAEGVTRYSYSMTSNAPGVVVSTSGVSFTHITATGCRFAST